MKMLGHRRMTTRAKPLKAAKLPAVRRRMSQAERTALSEGRMFDAAVALINAHGTHNTTLKAIGEKAGYSRGLASSRFGSKDGLFNELVREFYERWREESRQYIGAATGIGAFQLAIDALVHFTTENTSSIRAMFILYYETIGSSDLVRRQLADQHAGYRREAEKWIRQGIKDGTVRPDVDPEWFAIHYISFFFGIVYQWLVQPDAVDFKNALYMFRESSLLLISRN